MLKGGLFLSILIKNSKQLITVLLTECLRPRNRETEDLDRLINYNMSDESLAMAAVG